MDSGTVRVVTEKNTSVQTIKKDMRVVADFDIAEWCHKNDCQYSVETCEHTVKDTDGKTVETRKGTYQFPDIFVKRSNARRTVSDAFALLMTLLEESTVKGDAESAMFTFGMKHLNTTLKNRARAGLQDRVSKKAVRTALDQEIDALVKQVAQAAMQADIPRVQELSKVLLAKQQEKAEL